MEITEIKAASREYELKHPGTDQPLGIHFQLLPLHDPAVKKVERRIKDKILKIRSRGKSLTATEVEENELELISAAIVGWRWEADPARGIEQPKFKGEIPEFNSASVAKILRQQWIKDQLDEEIGDIADFFKE